MPERSSISTACPAASSTAATRRMPRVMKTRSSSKKMDGGVMRQIEAIRFIVTGALVAVNIGHIKEKLHVSLGAVNGAFE